MPTKSKTTITYNRYIKTVENLCYTPEVQDKIIKNRLERIYEEYFNMIANKSLKYSDRIKIAFNLNLFNKVKEIILNTIDLHEKGEIVKSYNKFKEIWTIEELWDALQLSSSLRNGYYRARKSETPIINREDMFHVPFEDREKVYTARYSNLGYPCLYLTHNVYTAWEEFDECPIQFLNISKYHAKQPLRLLDLRLRRSLGKNINETLSAFMVAMPLIMACSLKLHDSDEKYKNEYIIPQILLHTLIEEMLTKKYNTKKNRNNLQSKKLTPQQALRLFAQEGFDGIVYTSTKCNGYWSHTISTDCFVLPAKHVTPTGYCEELNGMFLWSEPVSFDKQWYKQFFVKNKKHEESYRQSVFYFIEKQCDSLKLSNLKEPNPQPSKYKV